MCMCVRGYKTKFNKVVRVFRKVLYCVFLSLKSLRRTFQTPNKSVIIKSWMIKSNERCRRDKIHKYERRNKLEPKGFYVICQGVNRRINICVVIAGNIPIT
jgi:hypothetical protein